MALKDTHDKYEALSIDISILDAELQALKDAYNRLT